VLAAFVAGQIFCLLVLFLDITVERLLSWRNHER
jgi:hypothetical protein